MNFKATINKMQRLGDTCGWQGKIRKIIAVWTFTSLARPGKIF